nr:Led-NPF-1=neuropeptide F-related peptide [Leptinotarsa decemlineata=Colorado potato beetles, cerebral ganglia, Peptide, 9 aa] [Leptinotarsa decemlineata]
ARGPQLRLR